MQPGRGKTYICLAAVLAGAGLLLALALQPARADTWEAMTTRLDKLQIEARSRKLSRSALRGKLVPGNSWDEYTLALNDAQEWRDGDNGGPYLLFANGDSHVDRARIERLVVEHAKALEHLRLGAQRSEGQYPYDWNRGSQMALPNLLGSRRLANLAAAQAKIWADNGRAQDAADLLLDVTVFARDLSTNGTLLSSLIGFAIYSTTSDGLRNLILSDKLSRKQLADLATKIGIVDRDLPSQKSTLANETMLFGISAVEESMTGLTAEEWWKRIKTGDWRLAAFPRSTNLDAFERKEAFLERSEKFEQMSFAAANREASAIFGEARTSPNPIVSGSTPDLSRFIAAQRDTLAHLRLVRAGAMFLATGEIPPLADPFGTNLLYKQEAGKAKIWSIGHDGRNNDGVGNWEGKPDIVFEISK